MHELYTKGHPDPLTDRDFTAADEPFRLFDEWLAEAGRSEVNDPNAMALATTAPDLLPNVRMVLLKGVHDHGFVFYTNSESQKGGELAANPQAALVFHWKSLQRRVRVRGPVEQVNTEDADAYFATRPLGSRIAAWASSQSRPLESRAVFEAAIAEVSARYPGEDVPRPAHWKGYRVVPLQIEFWHDRPFRMHDRITFSRAAPADAWTRTRLYP